MIWAMWVSACMLFNYRKCIKTSLHLWICYMISEFVIKKVSMMLLGILFSFYWLMNYLLSFIWLSYLNSKLNSYQMLRLSYLIWRNKKKFWIYCIHVFHFLRLLWNFNNNNNFQILKYLPHLKFYFHRWQNFDHYDKYLIKRRVTNTHLLQIFHKNQSILSLIKK